MLVNLLAAIVSAGTAVTLWRFKSVCDVCAAHQPGLRGGLEQLGSDRHTLSEMQLLQAQLKQHRTASFNLGQHYLPPDTQPMNPPQTNLQGSLQHNQAAVSAARLQQPQSTTHLAGWTNPEQNPHESSSASLHGPRLPLRPKKQPPRSQQTTALSKHHHPAEQSGRSSGVKTDEAQYAASAPSGQENSPTGIPSNSSSAVRPIAGSPLYTQRGWVPSQPRNDPHQPVHTGMDSSASQQHPNTHVPKLYGVPAQTPAAQHQSHLLQFWHTDSAVPLEHAQERPGQVAMDASSVAGQAGGATAGFRHAVMGDERSASNAGPVPAGFKPGEHKAVLGEACLCVCTCPAAQDSHMS